VNLFDVRVREAWPDQAEQVLGLIRGQVDPNEFRSVREWVRECYHPPSKHERIAYALNELLSACGVEAVFAESDDKWPAFEYLNMGDTYDVTLIYSGGKWSVGTWGDYAEAMGL